MARHMTSEEARATVAKRKKVGGGAPKKAYRQQFAALMPDADKRLKQLIWSKDEKIALDAINTVYDRALGKAKQTTELTGPDGQNLIPERVILELDADTRSQLSALRGRLPTRREQ